MVYKGQTGKAASGHEQRAYDVLTESKTDKNLRGLEETRRKAPSKLSSGEWTAADLIQKLDLYDYTSDPIEFLNRLGKIMGQERQQYINQIRATGIKSYIEKAMERDKDNKYHLREDPSIEKIFAHHPDAYREYVEYKEWEADHERYINHIDRETEQMLRQVAQTSLAEALTEKDIAESSDEILIPIQDMPELAEYTGEDREPQDAALGAYEEPEINTGMHPQEYEYFTDYITHIAQSLGISDYEMLEPIADELGIDIEELASPDCIPFDAQQVLIRVLQECEERISQNLFDTAQKEAYYSRQRGLFEDGLAIFAEDRRIQREIQQTFESEYGEKEEYIMNGGSLALRPEFEPEMEPVNIEELDFDFDPEDMDFGDLDFDDPDCED
jgi:transcriptional regulator with XRE-family HTH domain